MKALLLWSLLFCTNISLADELMQRWPDSRHDWRIVEQTTSQDGESLNIVISVPGGIFPAAVRLEDAKIKKVTLRLQKIRLTEGITFRALKNVPAGQPIAWKDATLEPSEYDLKSVRGFSVTPQGQDQVLEFTSQALELLQRGGRFQFIDAYR